MISAQCSLGLSDDDLSRWHDDDLTPARMAQIRTHTTACAACQERLTAFEEIGVGLRGLEPPPLDLARLLADLRDSTSSAAATSTPMPARMPTSTPHRSRRMVTGAAALAAVLALSLFAGLLFVNQGRPRPGGALATVTPGPLFPANEFPLMASVIAMSSPSDGWAFGSQEIENNSPVIALHFTGGKWTRVKTDVRGRVMALTMRGATDGWLVGANIYHYDGHSWKEVTLPQQEDYGLFRAVAATSPSSVWISVVSANPSVLHFDGTTWTRQSLPPPALFRLGNYDITHFAMASADEGWAVIEGYGQPGTTNPVLGLLLHYSNGVWKADRTCTDCGLSTVALASASDGWIGGGYSIPKGDNIVEVKPLLWRLTNGVWKDAPLPVSASSGNGGGATPDNFIQAIHLFSATEGWMIVADIPQHSLYRLQHGQWVEVLIPLDGVAGHAPNPYNADAFAFVSPNEFWTIGEYGITHYDNGVWTNINQ